MEPNEPPLDPPLQRSYGLCCHKLPLFQRRLRLSHDVLARQY